MSTIENKDWTMTFFEKKNMWVKEAQEQLRDNPDIMMHWTINTQLTITPGGNVIVKHDNSNIDDIVFENAVISIRDFFDKINKEGV